MNSTLHANDFLLFSDSKQHLWQWRAAIIARLARYRLTLHDTSCQVRPTRCGIPWLGFVVYPEKRLLKARKARYATRHLRQRQQDWRCGRISYAEFHASVQGCVAHAAHADTWGLRRTVFARLARG